MQQPEAPALPRADADVVPWVTALLQQAQALGASDLHVDPQGDGALLRLRIDGLLLDWGHVPAGWLLRLVARLKVMAQMDLGERRLPQDGRLQHELAGIGHVRVASLPTLHGEKLCLRLGDPGATRTLAELDLPPAVTTALSHALARPDGLILITGPTGSGKTTTLYACLQALNQRSRHIATVEDPVERILPGVNQTAIQPRIGLDFAQVLRALLRQDPDVLMVGEIRDQATAEMAVQAAETGHLVLSTLHTSSALEALTRLRHLGVPDYLLTDTVRLVLAQRLLRRLCTKCRGSGCTACQQGSLGRFGIYEFVAMTPALGRARLDGEDSAAVAAVVTAAGWPTLAGSARAAWAQGQASQHEILRVLGPAAAAGLVGAASC